MLQKSSSVLNLPVLKDTKEFLLPNILAMSENRPVKRYINSIYTKDKSNCLSKRIKISNECKFKTINFNEKTSNKIMKEDLLKLNIYRNTNKNNKNEYNLPNIETSVKNKYEMNNKRNNQQIYCNNTQKQISIRFDNLNKQHNNIKINEIYLNKSKKQKVVCLYKSKLNKLTLNILNNNY